MKNLLAVGVCIAVLIVTIGFMPIHGESEIYDSVIRLHVVANSDSKEDQSLKLSVRDAVLEESAELIRDCATREDAALAIQSNLDLFERTAAEVIEKEGYNYPVSVRLENEDYPSKLSIITSSVSGGASSGIGATSTFCSPRRCIYLSFLAC